MSATQLIGGALAAMTAAVIGAQLGVAGTVLGAAIGSVVAGAAGSLYTASLKHTKAKLASALSGASVTDVEVTTASTDTAGRRLGAISQPRRPWPRPPPSRWRPPPGDRRPPRGTGPWKPILVGTAAVFLLAIAGITGFELISGQSVSGGEGTTISQVGDGRSGGRTRPRLPPATRRRLRPPSPRPPRALAPAPSRRATRAVGHPSRSRRRAPNRPPAPSRPRVATPSTAGSEEPQVGSNDAGAAGG